MQVTHQTIPRSFVALAAGVVFLLALAGAASADPTVSVNSAKSLVVTGGSEDSSIEVTSAAGNLSVENGSGDLNSGGGPCMLVASNKVTCLYTSAVAPFIVANLNSGFDSATVDSSVPENITAAITGVSSATSEGAPLDVTIDDESSGGSVNGGPNPDRIVFKSPSACNVWVDGGGGDDEIHIDAETRDDNFELGCSPESMVTGGDGDDLIDAHQSKIDFSYEASAGHDVFIGGSGNDHITVGDGPDWAFGGAGNDRFYDNGGGDPSKIWGGPGGDVFTDWDISDLDTTFFDGGSGIDIVAYHNINTAPGVTVSLDNAANDGASGETDNIRTSVENMGDWVYNDTGQYRGDDTLTGSNSPNTIGGYNGNDTIDGLGGQDNLKGGDGGDTITGGAGADLIYGEAGDDVIYAEDGEVDTITCGSGSDTVHADAGDTVNGDCETVL